MINCSNKNTLWRDAITREMEKLKVDFDILDKGGTLSPGYKKSSSHLVFDICMTLERKTRWFKDGHRIPEHEQSTFTGVVSRESIMIILTYVSLSGLSMY